MHLGGVPTMRSRDLDVLLDHVPQLVKAYGRWPSFLYLLFATARGIIAAAILVEIYKGFVRP